MVKVLFHGAQATVLVNEGRSKTFLIQRGMRQGYPLSPYLYFIIAQALNALVKDEQQAGRLVEIQLPQTQE
jgi:hypothetical protein